MATTKVIKDLTEFNPGNPDYVLNATNAVTVSAASGANKYYFDGVYDGKFGLRIGTTVLTGVPAAHPFAVLNDGLTGITYTGTVNEGTANVPNPGGPLYTFYSGDVTITVTADFGVASYYCLNHGYMGGLNNFVSVYSEAGLRMPSSNAAYSGPTVAEGMMRNEVGQVSNGSASCMQHYNDTEWKNFVNKADTTPFNTDVLIVAGGGGTTTLCGSGGGGGGGILSGTLSITPGTGYSIQVGAGGTGSTGPGYTTGYTNGANSFLDASSAGGNTLTANGGGYSAGAGGFFNGANWPTSGNAGGSGGGGGGYQGNGSNTTGGASTQPNISPLTGYGQAGGSMVTTSPADYVGAGGGGAGGVGQDVNNSNNAGGNGGVGHISTIITTTMASANSIGEVSGSDVYYSGGGGGKGTGATGTGGLGGGGNASSNGTAATGGGGGGATCGNSGGGHTGGSGVLIIKYPDTKTCTLSSASGLTEIVDTTSISNFKVNMFKVTSEGTNGTGTITFS